MMEGYLIGRVTLRFENDGKLDLRNDLSALVLDSFGNLWTASDERAGIERLRPLERGLFGDHHHVDLAEILGVEDADDPDEIDIEGMAVEDDRLWITGSHTSTRKEPKGKNVEKDLKRLATVERRRNRYILARFPVADGISSEGVARLPFTESGNALTQALIADPHLGPFLHIPAADENSIQLASKENGFDIEGLAVRGDRVFLGLRGPVLRGWAALILEIEPRNAGDGRLTLEPIGNGGRLYRKHFVDLEGMGVRDLRWHGDDLLILSGPTMDMAGLQTVWRFKDATGLDDDTVTESGKDLQQLFDLPILHGADKAEGVELYDGFGEPGLMIVYDAPSDARKPDKRSVLADVYRLPV